MQYVSSGCSELTGYPSESLLYNRDRSLLVLLHYIVNPYKGNGKELLKAGYLSSMNMKL